MPGLCNSSPRCAGAKAKQRAIANTPDWVDGHVLKTQVPLSMRQSVCHTDDAISCS